jgi:Zn-dependent M28 family amino/carboxypeptidase
MNPETNIIFKTNLHNHLLEIVRERDPYLASQGHFYVKQYIKEQFSQWGEVSHFPFEYRGQKHENIILDLAGNSHNQELILIGAHYDGVPGTVAADDNGTGLAVLLELAKYFAQHPLKYPLRLVAFDLEESGLIGSFEYAKFLKQNQQKIRLMFSLEMLGYCVQTPNSQKYPIGLKYFYPDQGNFIALVGNLKTIPDLRRLKSAMIKTGIPCELLPVPNRGLWVRQTRLSDHSPFWDQGYNAMMVTDTAFLRNPNYHQRSDTLETINLDFLTGVCQGLIEGIIAI